jgi:hypothetical protein
VSIHDLTIQDQEFSAAMPLDLNHRRTGPDTDQQDFL